VPAAGATVLWGSQGAFAMSMLDSLFGPRPDDRIRAVQLHTLYKNAQAIYLVGYVNTLLVVLVMWQSGVSHAALLGWLVAMFLLLTFRVILCRRYWKDPEPERQLDYWQHLFTSTSLASGLMWGLAGWLFYLPDGGIYQAFLVIVLVSIGSGSMTFLAMHLPTYYGFFSLLMLPLLLRLVTVGDMVHVVMSVMLVLYYLVFVYLGRNVNQVFLESALLRFDNLEVISRLTAEKEAAERANVAKSRFLAAASHDLRQPLHALTLLSGALAERIQYREVKDIVSKIRSAVAALENLFNALLDISKLDSGVLQPQIEDVPLCTLFQRIENDHRPEAETKGLTFVVEDCGDVLVRSDSILLERVLRNFVTNAIRYTESGRITLSREIRDGEVVIRVVDTGIGIPPEAQENIFDEYFQVDNPGRQQSKGLGLGLAIVARIARLLNHKIELESVPGQGSVFSVHVPLCERRLRRREETTPLPEFQRDLQTLRVLIIDEETSVLEALKVLLEGWDCKVTMARSLEEAQEALREQASPPDAIISDYRLRDDITGVEAIGRIEAQLGVKIPAILITGDTAVDPGDGGYRVLHKPVQPARLRAFLKHVQSRKQEGSERESEAAVAETDPAP